MAETVKKTAPASNAFDIGRFSEDWAKAEVLRENRQQEEVKALDASQESVEAKRALTEESLSVKQDYLDGLVPLIDGSKKIAESAKRQRDLQSSGSFIDQLQAMQDEMLDPMSATSEGRAKARAELNAQAATLATEAEAKQNVISTNMSLVDLNLQLKQAGLQDATLLEGQHAQVMEAEATRRATILGGLENNAKAQQLLMDQMTPEQLTQAKTESVKNSGAVDVQGFPLTSSAIDAEIAKREAIQFNLEASRLGIAVQNEAFKRKANERILASLNSDQLGKLQLGLPVEIQFQNGEKQTLTLGDFDLPDVKAHSEMKQKAFADQIKSTYDDAIYGDKRADISQQTQLMDNIMTKAPVGSPEYNQAKLRKDELQKGYNAIDLMEKESQKLKDDPAAQIAFKAAQANIGKELEKQQASDAKIVETLAAKMSRGDKDVKVAATDWITGQPVNQESVVDYVTEGAANDKQDFSALLGKDGNRLFKKNYDEAMNKARLEQGGLQSALASGDRVSQKEQKKAIAYQALQTTVNQLSQSHSDKFIASQAELNLVNNADLQQNPIANARDSLGRKLWTPQSFVGFVAQADRKAIGLALDSAEFSVLKNDQNAVQTLLAGNDVTVNGQKISASTFQSTVGLYGDRALLESLDGVKPGLAKQYADWWADKGSTYAKGYIDAELGAGAKTLADASVNSLASTQIEGSMNDYGARLTQAYDDYKGYRQKMRQDWVSYDFQPGNRQAALLQFDSSLNDGEKTTIYRNFIKPMMAEAQKKNLSYEETNIMIEDALENADAIPGIKENPALKKAINKMLPNRQAISTQLQALTDSPWLAGNNPELSNSIWNSLGATDWKQEASKVGQSDVFGGLGGVTTGRRINTGLFGSYDGWLKDETKTRPYDWFRGLIMEESQQQGEDAQGQ